MSKLRHLEATDKMRDTILNLIETIPEVKSIAVIFDWNVGQSEFPYGMMIGAHGSVRLPGELHSMMLQTAKLVRHQSDVMAEILAGIDNVAGELTEKVKKLNTEIKDLEATRDALALKGAQDAEKE